MPIEFDFSELRGRIIAKYGNCATFAIAAQMSRAQVSERLNGKTAFKPEEIYAICSPEVLDIPGTEIGKYFFTLKV